MKIGMILAVTNRKLCQKDFFEVLENICSNGVDGILLREKDLTKKEYRQLACRCNEICKSYQVPLGVSHFAEVAAELEIPWIHLSVEEAQRREYNRKKFHKVGVSVHSLEEALEMERLQADYLVAGHVFATDCKKGLKPRGIEFLREICSVVKIPVYAIGGITNENIEVVLQAGAKGVCVMSGMMKETYRM